MLVCFKVILADLEAHQSFIYIPCQGLTCTKVPQNDLEAHQRTATVRLFPIFVASYTISQHEKGSLAAESKLTYKLTVFQQNILLYNYLPLYLP